MSATDADSAPPAPLAAIAARPRARGHIHAWSFLVTIIAGATLIALTATTASGKAAVATSVYVATVLGMFGVSGLYHRRSWTKLSVYTWMKRLDHSMIFVFIAGTYTPFTMLAMSQPAGWTVFGIVWGGAACGVALKLLWPSSPRWLGVPIYIALGWVAVFVLPELASNVGMAALLLLLAGGVLYTVGAIVYATRWPALWPATFGYHEVFHAFTVLAATCHYIAIWFAVYA